MGRMCGIVQLQKGPSLCYNRTDSICSAPRDRPVKLLPPLPTRDCLPKGPSACLPLLYAW